MYVELLIGNESGTKVYQPAVQEGIEWSTERKNTPGKLVFKVLKDDILDFSEGSPVRMKVDGDNVFFGFVFKQQRSKDKIITVTAYDQLRYLKNKDTKVYSKFIRLLLKMVKRMKRFTLQRLKVLCMTPVQQRTSWTIHRLLILALTFFAVLQMQNRFQV